MPGRVNLTHGTFGAGWVWRTAFRLAGISATVSNSAACSISAFAMPCLFHSLFVVGNEAAKNSDHIGREACRSCNGRKERHVTLHSTRKLRTAWVGPAENFMLKLADCEHPEKYKDTGDVA
ncbi:unnamed protein product [Symbiodinium pilosum]|uniref:Uncharacterized protein n=1 Tax=Symbiodinium pilosum TaxID=2952 RepID=A0A812S8N9_SYMPI|nr:unnamed protein product [Symbiodinium pilosum]